MMGQIQAVEPIHLRDVLIVLGFLLSVVASMVAVATSLKRQKREVTFGEEIVTKSFCKQEHASTDFRFNVIERDLRDVRLEIKADRDAHQKQLIVEMGKVHNRVNEVLEAVSELRGELKGRA